MVHKWSLNHRATRTAAAAHVFVYTANSFSRLFPAINNVVVVIVAIGSVIAITSGSTNYAENIILPGLSFTSRCFNSSLCDLCLCDSNFTLLADHSIIQKLYTFVYPILPSSSFHSDQLKTDFIFHTHVSFFSYDIISIANRFRSLKLISTQFFHQTARIYLGLFGCVIFLHIFNILSISMSSIAGRNESVSRKVSVETSCLLKIFIIQYILQNIIVNIKFEIYL